ncbi:hypothetical protein LR69_00086 [Geobacillus sp. BCO2]|nr:hypothetical protein LR69_00086 [Geobacillus sp. BCO2]
MKERLYELKQEALLRIDEAKDVKALNDVRVAYLGKKADHRSAARHGGAAAGRAPETRRAGQ